MKPPRNIQMYAVGSICSLTSKFTVNMYEVGKVICHYLKMAATAVQQPVGEFLSKKQKESPQDTAQDWTEIEELHSKK